LKVLFEALSIPFTLAGKPYAAGTEDDIPLFTFLCREIGWLCLLYLIIESYVDWMLDEFSDLVSKFGSF
jgi:hypothetical protein